MLLDESLLVPLVFLMREIPGAGAGGGGGQPMINFQILKKSFESVVLAAMMRMFPARLPALKSAMREPELAV